MQFIPSTWRGYGVNVTGGGTADPHNYHDAVHAAAYLCAHGAGQPDTPRSPPRSPVDLAGPKGKHDPDRAAKPF
jgi:membrane-bound lytic murein transglycosylase B